MLQASVSLLHIWPQTVKEPLTSGRLALGLGCTHLFLIVWFLRKLICS